MPRKKRGSVYRSIFIILILLSFVSVAIYYLIDYIVRPKEIIYPAFGIVIPPGYTIHGIDVSRYQQVINWNEVGGMNVNNIKIGFAFIKATEGIGKVDAQFRRNWLEAKKVKIPTGAYHYFIAGKNADAQAQNFIDIVKLVKGDLPPVLDIEQTYGIDKTNLITQLKIWLSKIEYAYKIKPLIYTNIDFYNNYLSDSFNDYPFWIAHYLQPVKPRLEHEWLFWQHSESGHVNGIKSIVDFNVFAGDSIQFSNLLLK